MLQIQIQIYFIVIFHTEKTKYEVLAEVLAEDWLGLANYS